MANALSQKGYKFVWKQGIVWGLASKTKKYHVVAVEVVAVLFALSPYNFDVSLYYGVCSSDDMGKNTGAPGTWSGELIGRNALAMRSGYKIFNV